MKVLVVGNAHLYKTPNGKYYTPTIYSYEFFERYLQVFENEKKKPYAVEMVNDPATITDMSRIALKINIALSKIIIKNANGVAYVTENYLQKLYPSKANKNGQCEKYFETYYSSIDLSVNDIKKAKKYIDTKKSFEIIHVSNAINSNIKGLKTFIEALQLVNEFGYNVTGCCIGDGNKLDDFKKYAKVLKVDGKIEFVGRLKNKSEVLDRLSKSDMLVLPTFMEGLPRTIIEAMSTGLPCISTPIAGIPELLNQKYLLDPNDSEGFANEIVRLIENPAELEAMSLNNIEISKKYTKDKLTLKRSCFYKKIKKLAEMDM